MKDLEKIIAPIKTVSLDQTVNSLPPVAKWVAKGGQSNVGEIDIRIDTQGLWYHEGSMIERQALIDVFSSILWCENNEYFLVTPVEKLKISVDDVPFIIVLSAKKTSQWEVVLNNRNRLTIGKLHPVVLREYQSQQVPYVNLRYDLWARVNRTVYEQWLNAALDVQASNDYIDGMVLSLSSGDYVFDVVQ